MKYIFDFDDVLFNNTKQFKEHMYACLEKAGVPRKTAEEYYQTVREKKFSLKAFIKHLFAFLGVEKKVEDVYEEIMAESKNFINTELLEAVKRIGVNNCYIVTNGDQEFNTDKLVYSGVWELFGGEERIHIVPASKKEAIREIYVANAGEEIVFIDDKRKFIDDLDLKDFPNLTTIHYTENTAEFLEKLRGNKNITSELKRKK